jgi:hypothetical protein
MTLGILLGTLVGAGIAVSQMLDTGQGANVTLPTAAPAAKAQERRPKPEPATRSVEDALRAHFRKLERGEYASAWRDLTGKIAGKVGPEGRWVAEQRRNKPNGAPLALTVRMLDGEEAEAKIDIFRTYEEGHRWCFKGHWLMVKTGRGWAIYDNNLSRRAC